MLTNRLQSRTARPSGTGGFTLVELLVVIGIIAILAGVALGPITNGIKKAKQSGGVQTSRTIALAEFSFANDHDQTYPDTSNEGSAAATAGTAAEAVARALCAGSYVSDPSIFLISGDTGTGLTKYTGTNPGADIAATNISWDFMGVTGGAGMGPNMPDICPVVWSTANGGTPVAAGTVAAQADLTAVVVGTNPFGTDGMACAYKNNSSKFLTSTNSGTTYTVTLVSKTIYALPNLNPLNGT